MKKRIIALLMTLVMVFALCACGPKDPNVGPASNPGTEATPGSEETKPPVEPGPAEKPYEGVTINYWSMWNAAEAQGKVIAEAAAAFEEQTGAKINIEWKGRDINTLLSAALESKEAIDLFDEDYTRIGQVYAPYTADLTAMAAAANYDDVSYPVFNNQSIAWAGYLNSITEQPNIGGVFYDRDAFEAAGITADPTTWAEFLDVCQKLKDNGVAPLVQDSAYTNFSFYYQLVRHIGEEGIADLRENGGWADNAGAVAAAQDIIDLVKAGYFADGTPSEFPSGENKIGLDEAAMVICADYVCAEVDGNTESQTNWGVFNVPAVEGGASTAAYMGTNSLAITSYSENQQAAFDFCLFLVTGEWGQKLADEAHQIPADPNNTCTSLPGAVETLLAADAPMSWCGELNTHPAWQAMRDEMTRLFAGAYETGADFCAAIDALY